MAPDFIPQAINTGPWVTAYTLYRLRDLPSDTRFTLPICSLATPVEQLTPLGGLLLPPLYHEALTETLQRRIVDRVLECFPVYGDIEGNRRKVTVVEVESGDLPAVQPADVLAFSVDTAVEEHGPHLPLATDTIQSYGVLTEVAKRIEGVQLMRPLDYGQLTWGLPFGFSVDLTAELLTEYVAGFANAVSEWRRAKALYVVDVHGSITHREAIVAGLEQSRVMQWAFRWLHEPLVEFASARGDQHAGGVETACVEHIDPQLLDPSWWPERLEAIAAEQMSFEKAVELTPDLESFRDHVQQCSFNGVIGDIRNYSSLDSELMFGRMVDLAVSDIERLMRGESQMQKNAGKSLW